MKGMTPEDKVDLYEEALHQIASWATAYPLAVFPEPDKAYYKRAHEVLTANGMTLDRLSAAAMRHVVEGVGRIARQALETGVAGDAQDQRR